MKKIAIVGAGFGGAVVAHQLAKSGLFEIEVFDSREHVAGNCHTARAKETNVMLHVYGPHIFNTNREDVWEYINSFDKFYPYTNRVKAITDRGVFSMPINLLTINQFFGKNLNPQEAQEFIKTLSDKSISEPKNFEEQALKFIGRDIYENFFKGYTIKQWGVHPKELPASILSRLPVRFNYDDNYYASKFQGIPVNGYTHIVEQMLSNANLKTHLSLDFSPNQINNFDHVFWSGPLDRFFEHKLGKLRYRTLDFKVSHHDGDYQGNPVLNYCSESVPYTRVSEHKHFSPWESHSKTTVYHEYSRQAEDVDIPYYPLALGPDKELLAKYKTEANKIKNITFIGRLGTYRYLNMDQVIGESLDLSKYCLKQASLTNKWPKFSNELPAF